MQDVGRSRWLFGKYRPSLGSKGRLHCLYVLPPWSSSAIAAAATQAIEALPHWLPQAHGTSCSAGNQHDKQKQGGE